MARSQDDIKNDALKPSSAVVKELVKRGIEDKFVCETEVIEEEKLVHYFHNPLSGQWKKSEVCSK